MIKLRHLRHPRSVGLLTTARHGFQDFAYYLLHNSLRSYWRRGGGPKMLLSWFRGFSFSRRLITTAAIRGSIITAGRASLLYHPR